jgi:hypothetical protein
MNLFPFSKRIPGVLLRLVILLALATTASPAAVTLSQQIDPPEVRVGETVSISFTLQNSTSIDVALPNIDGLQAVAQMKRASSSGTFGSMTSSVTEVLYVIPAHAGDFTIPAVDVQTPDGQVLHSQPMKLHVLPAAGPGAASPQPSPLNPQVPRLFNPPFNPSGPVVMPPNSASQPDGTSTPPDDAGATTSTVSVPVESDGRPAKAFMVVSPKTTDGYVGETIPMRIEFYLRLDVLAQQDSLPTIKGSDFLMNNLSGRPSESEVTIMNEPYRVETWVTAISAPKSGDLPFQMERDTYWAKPGRQGSPDPFGNLFFTRPSLAHESVSSNQLTFHIHTLPQEGRPDSFTGAIGQLKVTGDAEPASVTVGQPVTLHFTVSGEGNFDYVKCPPLTADPAWKSYTPSSTTDYLDESRTQGVKKFEQAIIPQKNGTLPLPAADFSYFDPTTKQYVDVPIHLPSVTVTGSIPPVAAPAPVDDAASAVDAPPAAAFLPNRLTFGSLHASLAPVYRSTRFWIVQGGLLVLLIIVAILAILRGRSSSQGDQRMVEARRKQFLHQEENAMTEAVRRNDALTFFMAARHAIQLQLGARWRLNPEAITLGEIRQRDPDLAASLEPLFHQADEVLYSGGVGHDLNLAEWELQVRRNLLQPVSS